jgi:hypothetical protein
MKVPEPTVIINGNKASRKSYADAVRKAPMQGKDILTLKK